MGGDTPGTYIVKTQHRAVQIAPGMILRTAGGGRTMSIKIMVKDADKVARRILKLQDGGETAIKKTVRDFGSRGPASVSKGIRQHYGVDTAAIKKAGPKVKKGSTHVQIAGIPVDDLTLEYNGETLTPLHFKMRPGSINPKGQQSRKGLIPGQNINFSGTPGQVAAVAPPTPYQITAKIKKGRVAFDEPAYLAPAGKSGGTVIPFQRKGDGRAPVHAIHTVSVPQMIENDARDTINKLLNEKLEKRFENYVKQILK